MRRHRGKLAALAAGAVALLLVPLAGAAPPVLSVPGTITAEATGPGGASVSFSVTATDDTDPNPVIDCTPSSGSTFALGTTTVNCTATDVDSEVGNASFDIVVQDTTDPTLGAMPANQTLPATSAAGASATYTTPTATDSVDTSVSVSCLPASGSTFPIGVNTVTCTATDDEGNSSQGTFTVTVQDTTAPVLTVPANIVREATSPAGASVSFTPTATDWSPPVTISCSPASGSTFPITTTTVSCTATDAAANASAPGTFTVKVQDTTAPSLTVPGPITAEATSSGGANVSYPAPTATDAGDASPTIACSAASGSLFPFGTTTVSCTATDDSSNSTSKSFAVTVRDTTPPVVSVPSDIAVEANGPSGSSVTYVASASDLGAPLLPAAVTCSPLSGSAFPLGSTTVNCTATDVAGNTATASFDVVVSDTTAPTLLAADVTLAATTAAGIRRTDPAMAAYLRSLTATDLVSKSVAVRTDAPDLFPVGKTPVRVTAEDGAGNQTARTVTVTVLPLGQEAPPPPDLTPPADVTGVRALAGDHRVELRWVPPKEDLAAVLITMTVADAQRAGRVVYRGLSQAAAVRGLDNDVQHRFVFVSVDKAGNRSRGVVALATPRSLLLAQPKPGAKVTGSPLLRWARVPGASYFNVQLFRGKTKILSAWPVAARLQLKKSWVYDRVKRTLAPGTYTWYVWPGLGNRAETRYGPLLGKSTFKVVKRKK